MTASARPPLAAVILAAGKGTRMKSALPKVLHPVGGRAMIHHVLQAAAVLEPVRTIVVAGPDMPALQHAVIPLPVAVQAVPRGTADALRAGLGLLGPFPHGVLLVLYGDTPLILPETLARVVAARHDGAAVAVLGFETARPDGYGRLRAAADGTLEAIVEHRDATPAEREIRLCNSGVMALDAAVLPLLDRISCDNAGGEYYLTDIVALARSAGLSCVAVPAVAEEMTGVNSRADLAQAEAVWQQRRRVAALEAGVCLIAPETVWFSHDTVLEADAVVEPHVVFGPGVHVAAGARVRAFSHLEGARLEAGAAVGPFARLRPGTRVGEGARIGNFVETKNTVLDAGAKAGHLSYLGDAHIGAAANIGAGTITCNYDGVAKHRTEIGAGAFIGSNSALVAPVRIGAGALVGAGSVITRDVAPDALALTRPQQQEQPETGGKLLRNRGAGKQKA